MPSLTFPVVPNGLFLSAVIGHDRSVMQALQAAGGPLPVPVSVRAAFDTGSDHTSVGPSLLASIGLMSAGSAQTRTASGVATVQYYSISLTLYDSALPAGPKLFLPSWTVANLPQDLPDTDVNIGMDLIREIELHVSGPNNWFSIAF